MTKRPKRKVSSSFKFMLTGLIALLFSGCSLAFLGYSIDGIQQLIGHEVASHYQTIELNYPLEKVIFELEKDIDNIEIVHHLVKVKGMTIQGVVDYLKSRKEENTIGELDVIATLKRTKQLLSDVKEVLLRKS